MQLTDHQLKFLADIEACINGHLSDENFGVEELAEDLGFSRFKLYRDVKLLTGKSVSAFIRDHRLKEGASLILQGGLTISEVSYKVGFSSPSYFNKCYNDLFGFSPGESLKSDQNRRTIEKILGAGQKEVQGVRNPMLVGAAVILVLALGYYFGSSQNSDIPHGDQSIAVLPFADLSETGDQGYFADGVTEEIIATMSGIPNLKVISRTSVMKYRDTNMQVKEIAAELGVKNILEGSVRRSGDQVRITAQLIDAETDEHIWSESYSNEDIDVLRIQQEVASKVLMKMRVDDGGQIAMRKLPTENLKAYELYLRGKDFSHRQFMGFSDHGLKAIDLMQEAIELDPDFAKAHAYLGFAILKYTYSKVHQVVDSALQYADRALELDSNEVTAYILRGQYYQFKGENEAALHWYLKANELDPLEGLSHISDLYRAQGKLIEAIEYAYKMTEFDPNNFHGYQMLSSLYMWVGMVDSSMHYISIASEFVKEGTLEARWVFPTKAWIHTIIGEFDEAEYVHRTYTLPYDGLGAMWSLGVMSAFSGEYEKCIHYFREAKTISEVELALAYSHVGRQDSAQAIFERFLGWRGPRLEPWEAYWLSRFYVVVDDKPNALKYLRMAYDIGWKEIVLIRNDPFFDEVREDPDFMEIYELYETQNQLVVDEIMAEFGP